MSDGSRDAFGGSARSSLSSPPESSFADALYPAGAPDPAVPDAHSDAQAFPQPGGVAGEGSFAETQHVSWFQKLAEAAWGVVIGLVLVLVTGGVLFWNEGRAVQTFKSLNEGASVVVGVASRQLDPANEGKLIHVQGELETETPLVDREFGIEARAARLVRTVEMYQWKEESRTETRQLAGGGEERVTTYTYRRVWSDTRIASERFRRPAGHANPPMRFRRAEVVAEDARLGAFRPGPTAAGRLPADDLRPVTEEEAARLRGATGPAHAVDGILYLGADPGSPRIGDLRITYHVAPTGPASFIGRQVGADLQEYQTTAGDRLLLARAGLVSAEAMFARAHEENVFLTWIIRVLGTIFMWVGFLLILRPVAVVGDLVPVIGSVLGAGVAITALLMTALLAPTVIGVAWLFYRPLIGIAVLVGGFAIAYGLRWIARKRSSARTSVAPPRGAPA